MATHEEAMFPELEGLKCWREDKFQLKKFKKETRYPHKKSSRSYAVHPACEKCHRLYPEMHFIPSVSVMWPVGTKCCAAPQVAWRFLVGTRKGKINLTLRSRVAAFQKRGVWLCMVL